MYAGWSPAVGPLCDDPATVSQRAAANPLRASGAKGPAYELHDNIEQPARFRAHSGRFSANPSRPGWSS